MNGWQAERCGSGHWRLTHDLASRFVIVTATPSDGRALRNARADLRRALSPQPKAESRPKLTKQRSQQPPPMRVPADDTIMGIGPAYAVAAGR